MKTATPKPAAPAALPDPLAAAEQQLADLETEARTLDERTADARHGGQVEEWMLLLNRGDALPAEIDEARARLLPLQVEKAWQTADALSKAEEPPQEALDHARARHAAVVNDPRRVQRLTAEQAAEYQLELVRATAAVDTAKAEHDTAAHATDVAVVEAEDLEAELVELTGEEPAEGDGVRARPEPLVRGSVHLRHPIDGSAVVVLNAQRPPRWAARLLDPDLFTPEPDPPRRPTVEPEVSFTEPPTAEQTARRQAAAEANRQQRDREVADYRDFVEAGRRDREARDRNGAAALGRPGYPDDRALRDAARSDAARSDAHRTPHPLSEEML